MASLFMSSPKHHSSKMLFKSLKVDFSHRKMSSRFRFFFLASQERPLRQVRSSHDCHFDFSCFSFNSFSFPLISLFLSFCFNSSSFNLNSSSIHLLSPSIHFLISRFLLQPLACFHHHPEPLKNLGLLAKRYRESKK